MVHIRNEAEIRALREANRIVAKVLKKMKGLVAPGVSTMELNDEAEAYCKKLGAKPAFKGYGGYPYSLCCSINHEVVHGFPRPAPLKEGDILSMDFGAILEGFYGDSAYTVPVGRVSETAVRLMDATQKSLMAGIEKMRPGNQLGDVSAAVQSSVENAGFTVVRQFVGHGVGTALHEEPQLPNYGTPGKGMVLKAGMVIAIEPMVNAGGFEVEILEDGWTAVTKDGKLSAHFEHTVAVTDDGPLILSRE